MITVSDWVIITKFDWFLLGFTKFDWVLPSFIESWWKNGLVGKSKKEIVDRMREREREPFVARGVP